MIARIRCKCKWEIFGVALLVTFPNHPGLSLLLQGDDIDEFKRHTDIMPLGDVAYATECSDDYLRVSQHDDGRSYEQYAHDAMKGSIGTLPK